MINLTAKKAYQIALVTERSQLKVSKLLRKIHTISRLFKENKIQSGDTVIVNVAGEMQMLAILRSLLQNNISGVIIDPASSGNKVKEISGEYRVDWIIADERLYNIKTSSSFNLNDIDFGSSNVNTKINWPDTSRVFTFISADDKIIAKTLSWVQITDYFDKLEKSIAPGDTETLFLSTSLPFRKRLLTLLWASFKGFTVVVDTLKNETNYSKYFKAVDQQMNFGLFYFGSDVESINREKYDLLFKSVKFADENNFTAVWTPERHFNDFGGLYPNPAVLSSALSVCTSKVQIRSGSLVSPLHHPVRIAEDWSLVDNLSNGRVGISFASGWQCDDFILFPENFQDRNKYMLEQIDIVRKLWRGEKVSFKNGLGFEKAIEIFPKPVQETLPVWITVAGRTETFIDAGRLGANILTHLLWQDSEELVEKIAAYRKALKDNGYDPKSKIVSVMVHTFLGESNEFVKQKVKEPLKNYIMSSTQLIQSMEKSIKANSGLSDDIMVDEEVEKKLMDELGDIAFERFFEHTGLLGTLDKARQLIIKLKKCDIDEVACLIDFGLGQNDIMSSLTYLNELRKICKQNEGVSYPVTITQCTMDDINGANAELSGFIKNQKVILVEEDLLNNIPEDLMNKARIVSETNDGEFQIEQYTYLNERDVLFNENISEEF